jgi:uncharacterized Zn-binding protein involved in type VI secretion
MGKPAARIGDMHVCPMVTGVVPHVGGPIILGSVNVLTGKMPQARVGDMLTCVGPPDTIAMGSAGVFVNNMPAARMGDITAHGGNIVLGLPTVLIGETGGGGGGGGGGGAGAGSSDNAYTGGGPSLSTDALRPTGAIPPTNQVALAYANYQAQVQVLLDAAKNGTPFCEVCFQKALAELSQTVTMARAGFAPTVDDGTKQALAQFPQTKAGDIARDLNGKNLNEVKQYMDAHYPNAQKSTDALKPPPGQTNQIKQTKWILPDGTVVRVKETVPPGGKVDRFRNEPSMSVSVLKRDANGAPLPDSYQNEALKVTSDGTPVPKGPQDVDVSGLSPSQAAQRQDNVMAQGHRSIPR